MGSEISRQRSLCECERERVCVCGHVLITCWGINVPMYVEGLHKDSKTSVCVCACV